MNAEKSWKPLTISGTVLLLNGLVFSITTLAMQSSALWEPAIGCLGSGIPLLVIGLLQKKKSNKKAINLIP